MNRYDLMFLQNNNENYYPDSKIVEILHDNDITNLQRLH